MLEISPVVARPLLVDLEVSVSPKTGGDLRGAVGEKAATFSVLI